MAGGMKSFSDIACLGIENLVCYEPGRPVEEVARELGFDDASEITKLASNENSLGPSPEAVAAMRRSAVQMHRYPDGGSYYLRQALAGRLKVEPSCVLPVNGSNEALELLAHVFLGGGKSIVMAEYAFVVYRLISAMFGAGVISVPMKKFTHDVEAMLAAVEENTRVVFVGNPNNPTGTAIYGEDIDRLVEGVPDGVIVCFDEAYVELLPEEKQPDTLRYVREGRKVVILRTFSKSYGLAGLRIGYAVAAKECIDLLERVRQPFNVNAMALAAALAALEDEAHIRRTRNMVTCGLEYLEKGFTDLGLPFIPSCANFVLVETAGVSREFTGRKVFEALQREGIIVRPMDVYGLPGYLRITVGTEAENARLIGALRRILKETGDDNCD